MTTRNGSDGSLERRLLGGVRVDDVVDRVVDREWHVEGGRATKATARSALSHVARVLWAEGVREPIRGDDAERERFVAMALFFMPKADRDDTAALRRKLAQWWWATTVMNGGGSLDERINELDRWTKPRARRAPEVLGDAAVAVLQHEARLLRLTRSSKDGAWLYRAVQAVMRRRGQVDLLTGETLDVVELSDAKVEIHHVFPKKFLDMKMRNQPKDGALKTQDRDAIVNLAPMLAYTNKWLRGERPSTYVRRLEQAHSVGAYARGPEDVDRILRTHLIDPVSFRENDFDTFREKRAKAFVGELRSAIGDDRAVLEA